MLLSTPWQARHALRGELGTAAGDPAIAARPGLRGRRTDRALLVARLPWDPRRAGQLRAMLPLDGQSFMQATLATSALPFTSQRPCVARHAVAVGQRACTSADCWRSTGRSRPADVAQVQQVRDDRVDLLGVRVLGAFHGIARFT
jgi:hypothetical protein